MNICRKCKYNKSDETPKRIGMKDGLFDICLHPKYVKKITNFVTGEITLYYRSCDMINIKGKCKEYDCNTQ